MHYLNTVSSFSFAKTRVDKCNILVMRLRRWQRKTGAFANKLVFGLIILVDSSSSSKVLLTFISVAQLASVVWN